MKKLLLIISFILCLALNSSAMSPAFLMQVAGGATVSCDETTPKEDDASSGDHNVGQYDDRTRVASKFVYGGATSTQICKVTLYVDFTGSSTHNYEVEIMSDNSDSPNAVIGTSNTYDLSGIGTSETTFDFIFSTPSDALTNGTKYWVVLKSSSDADDGSNFAEWHTETSGATEDVWDYDTTGPGWTQVSSAATKKYVLYSQ